MLQTVQTHAQLFFYTHISIFRFIRSFKVPLLFNRKLYVNMGKDSGGLLFLDGAVHSMIQCFIIEIDYVPRSVSSLYYLNLYAHGDDSLHGGILLLLCLYIYIRMSAVG